ELFVTPSRIETVGTGEIVATLPIDFAKVDDGYVEAPPKTIPIAIPFSVPKQSPEDKCNVYVIYRVEQDVISVAKYGITCQTETDNSPSCKRPSEQVKDFNKENDGGKYYYSIITPFPVSKKMALTIERAMTAQYIYDNKGDLPSKHNLPCFVKVPEGLPEFEEKIKKEKRVEKATEWLNNLIKQYGK
ncbi:MAG: hypothetical protein Q4C98_11570, partial [Capnocytophaga sp.]|nr:hypothetical protein [Capnocytophaga sp.]